MEILQALRDQTELLGIHCTPALGDMSCELTICVASSATVGASGAAAVRRRSCCLFDQTTNIKLLLSGTVPRSYSVRRFRGTRWLRRRFQSHLAIWRVTDGCQATPDRPSASLPRRIEPEWAPQTNRRLR